MKCSLWNIMFENNNSGTKLKYFSAYGFVPLTWFIIFQNKISWNNKNSFKTCGKNPVGNKDNIVITGDCIVEAGFQHSDYKLLIIISSHVMGNLLSDGYLFFRCVCIIVKIYWGKRLENKTLKK